MQDSRLVPIQQHVGGKAGSLEALHNDGKIGKSNGSIGLVLHFDDQIITGTERGAVFSGLVSQPDVEDAQSAGGVAQHSRRLLWHGF